VSATEARVHFGELLRAVTEDAETLVIERFGQPIAVVLPFQQYQNLLSNQLMAHWEIRLEEARKLFQETYRGVEPPDPVELVNAGRQERDDAILGDSLRLSYDVQTCDETGYIGRSTDVD
jgi:prevent-host-death family protein